MPIVGEHTTGPVTAILTALAQAQLSRKRAVHPPHRPACHRSPGAFNGYRRSSISARYQVVEVNVRDVLSKVLTPRRRLRVAVFGCQASKTPAPACGGAWTGIDPTPR